MGNEVDFVTLNVIVIEQEPFGRGGHDHNHVGKVSDMFNNDPLVVRGVLQDGVQDDNCRFGEGLKNGNDVVAIWPTEDTKFVLNNHDIAVLETVIDLPRVRRAISHEIPHDNGMGHRRGVGPGVVFIEGPHNMRRQDIEAGQAHGEGVGEAC